MPLLTNDLRLEQITPRTQPRREHNIMLPMILNQLIDRPHRRSRIPLPTQRLPVRRQLRPDRPGALARPHLRDIHRHRALVACGDDVVVPLVVVPFKGDFVPGDDGDGLGHWGGATDVAGDGGVGDVFHGVVVGGGADVHVAAVAFEDLGMGVSGWLSEFGGTRRTEGEIRTSLTHKP